MTSTKALPLKDSQPSAHLALQNQTTQKQLDMRLTAKETLAWELLNFSPDGITLVTSEGTIVFANETTCRHYGKAMDALIGTSIWDCIPSDKVAHWRIILKQVIETGQPIAFVDQDNGIWNKLVFHPIHLEPPVKMIALYALDITQQINAEERLKRLTLQLVTLQEDERRRISQDLHDDIGQSMTALILGLKAIDGAVTAGEKDIGQQIKDAIRSVEAIMKQVRQVFYQLHPPSLDVLPLAQALESFCHTFSQQTGLHVDFNSETLPPIPDLQATALYRLVQEGLNNAAKHAHATAVWVNLDYSEGEVSLSVEDNGQGFNPKTIDRNMGLLGIRDRFLMLNGSFDIESAPGKGTRLFGSLPLAMRKG
jgi:PAS domain S-box-containing protein